MAGHFPGKTSKVLNNSGGWFRAYFLDTVSWNLNRIRNVRKIIAALYITTLSALWCIFYTRAATCCNTILKHTKNSCDWRLLSFLWISSSVSDVTLLTQQQDRQRRYNVTIRRIRLTIVATDKQYLLTEWSTVLLGKLNGSQLVKKFPAFGVTRRFITAFTTARHLFLSCARLILSMSSSHFLNSHLNIILPSTHRSSQVVSSEKQ